MPATLLDRITPTAVGIVSRAWVIREVEQHAELDAAARARAIDVLCAYEPPRRHPVRNNVIFWVGALGSAMLAEALGAPGWIGFVAALAGFTALARQLAVRALRWRIKQLLSERAQLDAER